MLTWRACFRDGMLRSFNIRSVAAMTALVMASDSSGSKASTVSDMMPDADSTSTATRRRQCRRNFSTGFSGLKRENMSMSSRPNHARIGSSAETASTIGRPWMYSCAMSVSWAPVALITPAFVPPVSGVALSAVPLVGRTANRPPGPQRAAALRPH